MMGHRGDMQYVNLSAGRQNRPSHDLIGNLRDLRRIWKQWNPSQHLHAFSGQDRISTGGLIERLRGRDRFRGRTATRTAFVIDSLCRQDSWRKMTADYGTPLLLGMLVC